jgi:hypothetical protein
MINFEKWQKTLASYEAELANVKTEQRKSDLQMFITDIKEIIEKYESQ